MTDDDDIRHPLDAPPEPYPYAKRARAAVRPEAALYRRTVLSDLLRNRGVPAEDHAHLHDPELSPDEWEGTDEERERLRPLIRRLQEHLKANPQRRRDIVTAPR